MANLHTLLVPALLLATLSSGAQPRQSNTIPSTPPNAQTTFIVTIDGHNQSKSDSCYILGESSLTGAITFYKTFAAKPNKIRHYTVTCPSPGLLKLNNSYFIAADGDSLLIGYDTAKKQFAIVSGRYPANYQLYNSFLNTHVLFESYSREKDNYEEYLGWLDTLAVRRTRVLAEEKAAGRLSPEAADYLSAYIKYNYLSCLFLIRSPTLTRSLPATHGAFIPTVSLADCRQDQYADMLYYSLFIQYYLQALTTRLSPSDPYYTVGLAIDSLSGDSREAVVYRLIAMNFLRLKNDDRTAFAHVFERALALHPAPFYAEAIQLQYEIAILERLPLDPGTAAGTILSSPSSDNTTLASLLDKYAGKPVLLRFPDPEAINSWPIGTATNNSTPQHTVLWIYLLKGSYSDWLRQQHKKPAIANNIYFVENGQESPLANYLHIDHLPRLTLLDESHVVSLAEITPQEILASPTLYHWLDAR